MMLECCVNCLSRWKLWIRPLVIIVYALAALVFVPLFLAKSIQNGFNRRDQEILIAGIFAWVAVPLSLWEIILHFINYTQPRLQKHIIRVRTQPLPNILQHLDTSNDISNLQILHLGNKGHKLNVLEAIYIKRAIKDDAENVLNDQILWMVPIYAINAWIGLIYPKHAIYVDSARECYEAYVIYNFMKFLLNYLNMEMDLEVSLELKPQVKHIFPLCCLPEWTMGSEFVHICKHGILQYTVVRPITTALSFICKINGVYGDGEFRGDVAFPYLVTVNNLSQFVAMYCLVMFYRASLAELKPMRPLPKFLCIKAVVFFSFFQGVLIALLVYLEVIKENKANDEDGSSISSRLQNFLICIEMCLAAIAHHYSFSYRPYVRAGYQSQGCCRAFLAMWDISDVQHDISEHLGIVGSTISRRIRGRSMYTLARGSDEYSNLVARQASSAPSNGLYQNDSDPMLTYGTIDVKATENDHVVIPDHTNKDASSRS